MGKYCFGASTEIIFHRFPTPPPLRVIFVTFARRKASVVCTSTSPRAGEGRLGFLVCIEKRGFNGFVCLHAEGWGVAKLGAVIYFLKALCSESGGLDLGICTFAALRPKEKSWERLCCCFTCKMLKKKKNVVGMHCSLEEQPEMFLFRVGLAAFYENRCMHVTMTRVLEARRCSFFGAVFQVLDFMLQLLVLGFCSLPVDPGGCSRGDHVETGPCISHLGKCS